MKELFLMLLFSEWIQLTPVPVNIVKSLSITPGEAISAITSGAALHVDLETAVPGVGSSIGIPEAITILEGRVSPERVRAYLETSKGSKVLLDQGYFALEDDKSWLVLTSSSGVPTGVEFTEVTIESEIEIRDVLIYWKNCGK